MAGGIAEQLRSFTEHRQFSWLDLEDPRRNDGTFTKHEQTCQPLGAHEGDAKLIVVGRVGEVYEKEFDGVRAVSKLLSMTGKRGKDEGDVDEGVQSFSAARGEGQAPKDSLVGSHPRGHSRT